MLNHLVNRLLASWTFRRNLDNRINAALSRYPGTMPTLPAYQDNPYRSEEAGELAVSNRSALPYSIFVTSRFRSGSTLLWRISMSSGVLRATTNL